jgi:hypothetical protein|nr:MAG: hypothetical protein [Bacteriophage sp.]
MADERNTLVGILSMPQAPSSAFQEKCIIPAAQEQVITADGGYTALSKVTVAAIPSNYGRISFNGYELKVE